MSGESEQIKKLFIGGLSFDTTEETLKKYFEKWGQVMECVVLKDSKTRHSRGFGFVEFSDVSEVDAVMSERPHRIDNRVVETKRAIPRHVLDSRPGVHMTVKKLFVGGIREDIQESHLRDYFSVFGNVVNVEMVNDRLTGKRRGFAFVLFDDYDPVDQIICQKFHNIKDHHCEVRKALTREELDSCYLSPRGARMGGFMTGRGGFPGRGGRPPMGQGNFTGPWNSFGNFNPHTSNFGPMKGGPFNTRGGGYGFPGGGYGNRFRY
uniref:heterogeneous nuclear ribonucleoprotein A1-like n=1 Tax=Myxine glutinosa TaxID=7769 RepID=UPI00358F280F